MSVPGRREKQGEASVRARTVGDGEVDGVRVDPRRAGAAARRAYRRVRRAPLPPQHVCPGEGPGGCGGGGGVVRAAAPRAKRPGGLDSPPWPHHAPDAVQNSRQLRAARGRSCDSRRARLHASRPPDSRARRRPEGNARNGRASSVEARSLSRESWRRARSRVNVPLACGRVSARADRR
jgi:hypothetical protein